MFHISVDSPYFFIMNSITFIIPKSALNRRRSAGFLPLLDYETFSPSLSSSSTVCTTVQHAQHRILFYRTRFNVQSLLDARWVHTSLFWSLTLMTFNDFEGEDCCSVHQYAPCATPSVVIYPQKNYNLGNFPSSSIHTDFSIYSILLTSLSYFLLWTLSEHSVVAPKLGY